MKWTVDQINALVKGGLWTNSVIFVTWDDCGGWWDHVDPPSVETWNKSTPQPSYKGTQFRYGSRVGCLVLGRYSKQNHVSKVLHSHVSILRFCEALFNLPSINNRDAVADDMSDCFDMGQVPFPPPPIKP